MDTFARITVSLSKDEFAALRDVAGQEYRHPREQARWLLRLALGLSEVQENANRGALGVEVHSAAVAP